MTYLKPVFKRIKRPFKKLKVYTKQRFGWLGVPKIQPFTGYGNTSEIFIYGRVMEDKGLEMPKSNQNIWQNTLAMIKRFSGDEIAGVMVEASLSGRIKTAETNEDGFFQFHFKGLNFDENVDWATIDFRLLDQIVENQPETHATSKIRIVHPSVERIIVSDIDDTVLISHSTQTLKKLKLMLFKNATSRLPFRGVTELYRALADGLKVKKDNPFFYVSSSEWNLYDLLYDFFEINKIPRGVFMLKFMEHSIFKFWKSGGGNHEHKYANIKSLLEFYKDQSFILVGDSGQRDPEIYRRLALEFPDRIETIYIRKIKPLQKFTVDQKTRNELEKVGTDFLEMEDSLEAAKHARTAGYFKHHDVIPKIEAIVRSS